MSLAPPGEDAVVLPEPKYVFGSPADDNQATICVNVNIQNPRLRNPCFYLLNNIVAKFDRHIHFSDCINRTILVITSYEAEKEIADFIEKQIRDMKSPPKTYLVEGCGFLNATQLRSIMEDFGELIRLAPRSRKNPKSSGEINFMNSAFVTLRGDLPKLIEYQSLGHRFHLTNTETSEDKNRDRENRNWARREAERKEFKTMPTQGWNTVVRNSRKKSIPNPTAQKTIADSKNTPQTQPLTPKQAVTSPSLNKHHLQM